MKLSRTAVRAGAARRPTTVGARRATVVGTVLAFAGMAYVFWSAATDSGIVGWFNARQARGSGRYDETLSFMLSMFCVMIPAYAVALPLARLGRSARLPVRTAEPHEMLATQSRTALFVGLGLFIAIWGGGFGAYEYYTLRTQQEMHATYEPVDVGAPVGAASSLRFVALRGKVHPNGYMKRTENHNQAGTSFIPLVATTARDPAVPVHWFLRAEGEPYLPATIYGHATGETLPRTIREAFERNGTNIAPDAVLVSFVATDSTGRVLDDSGENFLLFVGGCGAVSLVTLAMVAAMWFKLRAQRRRLTSA